MNEIERKEASYLRSLSSSDAAKFLIEKYYDDWPTTIRYRSWEKYDQLRLARRFLRGKVHATDRGYEDFLSFMSINAFLSVVEEGLPEIPVEKLELLSYYLMPSLQKVAKTQSELERVKSFSDKLATIR